MDKKLYVEIAPGDLKNPNIINAQRIKDANFLPNKQDNKYRDINKVPKLECRYTGDLGHMLENEQ